MTESSGAINSEERPEFLEEFKKTNPHLLKKGSIELSCRNSLLTQRHRCESEICGERLWSLPNCFIDHAEAWEDTNTGLPVVIAHPYCCHTDKRLYCMNDGDRGDDELRDRHAEVAEHLAERGLWWKVSNASWYYKDTNLVVIARVDVLGNIALPVDWDRPGLWKEQAVQHHRRVRAVPYEWCESLPFDLYPSVSYVRPVEDDWYGRPDMGEEIIASKMECPPLDYEMIEARKLAEESVIRNRMAKRGPAAEAEGDYQLALNCYCDTAYVDRIGGFHRLAREQLAEAKRIITAHPDLDTTFLHFKNRRDREFICGKPNPTLSWLHLEGRLHRLALPDTWRPFISDASGYARARIGTEKDRYPKLHEGGFVYISQGGNLNQWKASVTIGDGPHISTASDGRPQSLTSPENYCCETPEAAVEAAIDIWRRYDELASADILDSSRVER